MIWITKKKKQNTTLGILTDQRQSHLTSAMLCKKTAAMFWMAFFLVGSSWDAWKTITNTDHTKVEVLIFQKQNFFTLNTLLYIFRTNKIVESKSGLIRIAYKKVFESEKKKNEISKYELANLLQKSTTNIYSTLIHKWILL